MYISPVVLLCSISCNVIMIINVTDLNDICNICGSSYKWPSASILLDGKRMCVCVCVCFSYKEGDVCEEGCTGLLADPPPVRINGCFLRPCSLTRESGCHLTDENSLCEMDTVLTRSQANHAAV